VPGQDRPIAAHLPHTGAQRAVWLTSCCTACNSARIQQSLPPPASLLQFGLYDWLNRVWETAAAHAQATSLGSKDSAYQPQKLQYFCCGLVAGLMAKLATHPLDVAKKRFQVAGLQRSLRYGARVDMVRPACKGLLIAVPSSCHHRASACTGGRPSFLHVLQFCAVVMPAAAHVTLMQ
jgi:hypothetical protein